MSSKELRERFLDFFEKKGHKVVPSSSLIPTDPSVLFTSAGMQQFKLYYLGEKSPYGNKVASCQKCFRTSDIEEVGDESHLTFFEMLGNFSFGGYFKEEAIKLAYELLFKELKLSLDNVIFTVFGGDKEVSEDKESVEIWKKLGISENKIKKCPRSENFWGPTGEEGPCGPTTEIHYDLTRKPCAKDKGCIPNCDCGRFVELWNLVFNEYYQDQEKKLTPLKQKGVDTGMGLERLAMIAQNKPSVFETDLFKPMISRLLKECGATSSEATERMCRVIADHIRGSVFLIADGVLPLNVERGYILRRILRRTFTKINILRLPQDIIYDLAKWVIRVYQRDYSEVKRNETNILTIFQKEKEKFDKIEKEAKKEFDKTILKLHISSSKIITGKDAFDLYQNYGFSFEKIKELVEECGLEIDEKGFKEEFQRHREISRAGVEKKFGGIGKEATYTATKLHTATHLLQAALREILGKHVHQMGSDITSQRLRFDFSHPQKMADAELKKVEDLVNQKIKENLEVKKEEMSYKEAINRGALAFFRTKYPERVTVYSIGLFSKEICAGPHAKKTSELGQFQIIKEESSGSGIRRIRAILK